MNPVQLFRRYRPGLLRHIRRRWLRLRCVLAGVDQSVPLLTVPSSNGGRSAGDIFLALASLPPDSDPRRRPVFITHPNHAEVVDWFAHRLGVVVLSKDAENWVAATRAKNIHWHIHEGPDPLPGGINNPWRFFIHHGASPRNIDLRIKSLPARLRGKCVVFIPERGDNNRLGSQHLGDFAAYAISQGYRCYTNGYTNSNFAAKPPLPGTEALTDLSLGEMIALARDTEIIFVGTRCGLFDIVYLTRPAHGASLVILYPPVPAWIWEARFIRPDLIPAHADHYHHQNHVHEFHVDDFTPAHFTEIIPPANS